VTASLVCDLPFYEPEGNGMLRISVVDSRTQRRLVLEGKVIAPWVSELRTTWKTAKTELRGRALVIDLRNITVISQEGENALLELISEGAKFRCSGVLTKHLIQQLTRRCKRSSSEPIKAVQHGTRDDQGQE
jgi:hypothetical protein